MTPLMKKAGKGNRDALTALYQSNKTRILYICNLLLCDSEAAEPTDDNGTIEAEDQPVITRIIAYTAEEYEALTGGGNVNENEE